MVNKNNKQSQGTKVEMKGQALPESEKVASNKVIGNPDDKIQQAAAQGNGATPTFEQNVDIKDINKAIIKNLQNLSQTCYNFSIKYSEIPGDFKKIGDAAASYANVLEQKEMYEANQAGNKQKKNE